MTTPPPSTSLRPPTKLRSSPTHGANASLTSLTCNPCHAPSPSLLSPPNPIPPRHIHPHLHPPLPTHTHCTHHPPTTITGLSLDQNACVGNPLPLPSIPIRHSCHRGVPRIRWLQPHKVLDIFLIAGPSSPLLLYTYAWKPCNAARRTRDPYATIAHSVSHRSWLIMHIR